MSREKRTTRGAQREEEEEPGRKSVDQVKGVSLRKVQHCVCVCVRTIHRVVRNFTELFSSPDTLLPWRRADNPAGHTEEVKSWFFLLFFFYSLS